MKPSIRYIASIILLILAFNARGQDSLHIQAKDSVQIAIIDSTNFAIQDSSILELKEKHFSIFIGTDYGKLILTAAQVELKYEFNIAVQFAKNLRATADYGFGELTPPNAIENGTYTSTGNYYRIGIDYIFNIAPKTYLSLGGMYANSTFKDEGQVVIESDVWSTLDQSFVRNDLSATWAEFVLTSEAPILNRDKGMFSNLYWGIKFRLRFMVERPRPENFDVYAIPGYGRTWNDLVPAANLFIVYKI